MDSSYKVHSDLYFRHKTPINFIILSKKEISISIKTKILFYLDMEEKQSLDIKEQILDMELLDNKALSIATNKGNIKFIKKDENKKKYYIYKNILINKNDEIRFLLNLNIHNIIAFSLYDIYTIDANIFKIISKKNITKNCGKYNITKNMLNPKLKPFILNANSSTNKNANKDIKYICIKQENNLSFINMSNYKVEKNINFKNDISFIAIHSKDNNNYFIAFIKKYNKKNTEISIEIEKFYEKFQKISKNYEISKII